MMERIVSTIIIVILLAPVWIPLGIVTFPVWGIALFSLFTKPIHDIEYDVE